MTQEQKGKYPTVKQVTKMTRQEVFEYVARHLLKQGEVSAKDGQFLYRGPKGTSCAVGCLIPDSQYTQEMEGNLALNLTEFVGRDTNRMLNREADLLSDLQDVHDNYNTEDWIGALRRIGAKYYLKTSFLNA